MPEVSKDVTDNILQINADHPNFTSLDVQKCENTINNQLIDFECGIHDIEDFLNSGMTFCIIIIACIIFNLN